MWLVSDKVMEHLLGGEFCQVVELKKMYPKLKIKDLYKLQFKYFTYDGFRKFYNKYLSDFVNEMNFLDDNSLIVKFVKFILRIK